LAQELWECPIRFDPMRNDDGRLHRRSSAVPVAQSTESSRSARLHQCVEYLKERKELAVEIEDYLEAQRCKQVLNDLDQRAIMLRKFEERKRVAVNGEDYDAAKALKTEVQQLRMVLDKVVTANLALPKIEMPIYVRTAALRAQSQSPLQIPTQAEPLRHAESQCVGGGWRHPVMVDDEVLVTAPAAHQPFARSGEPQRGSSLRVAAATESQVLKRGNECGAKPALPLQNLGQTRTQEQNESSSDEQDGLPWWLDTETTISCIEKGSCMWKRGPVPCRPA